MCLAVTSQLKSNHYKPVMGLFSFADKHNELWLRLTAKWLFQTTVLFCYGSCDIKFFERASVLIQFSRQWKLSGGALKMPLLRVKMTSAGK